MSIDSGTKRSLLGPLADEYELREADADRILANVQAASAREVRGAEPAPVARAAARSSSGKKMLLLGASCLTLVIGAVAVVYAPPAKPRVVAITPAPPAVPIGESNAPENAPENAHAIPAVAIDDLPNVASAPPVLPNGRKVVPSATAPTSTSAPASNDTLERETLLLEGARRALKLGDDTKALALLDEHARLFPNGWLASDRAGERIIVLCSLGRRAEATREAAAFLDGRSKSPLTRRVETSCAGQPATKAPK